MQIRRREGKEGEAGRKRKCECARHKFITFVHNWWSTVCRSLSFHLPLALSLSYTPVRFSTSFSLCQIVNTFKFRFSLCAFRILTLNFGFCLFIVFFFFGFAYFKCSMSFHFICHNPKVFAGSCCCCTWSFDCCCCTYSTCCCCSLLFNLLATKRSLPNSFEFSFVCTDRHSRGGGGDKGGEGGTLSLCLHH